MVQIHVNQTPEEQFLYECPCTSRIDSLTRDITQIYNLQSKIQRLVLRVEERLLANSKDCLPDAAIALKRALSEAKTYVSKDQVLHKKPLSPHVLKDHIQNIEREIMINQSVAFLDSDLLQQLSLDTDLLHEDITQLWWAGKELMRDKQLCDYVGKNEKTKIVVRLHPPGSGRTQHSVSHIVEQQWTVSIRALDLLTVLIW
ncbi:uncharacterized protein LOC131253056 isoform X2 [Magnolia sinica]|uniref:uncharacterized protein LOC131253056 isoform X2 n=1 Tax=Magnolia sinica TaxID=86752 RepID=UPI00265A7AE3|nr:uncharacterized protein LOC131253056 isoform X2 [Magnolia sinica]